MWYILAMKLLGCLLLVVLCGCGPSLYDIQMQQIQKQGDLIMQRASRQRADIDARLAEAKNAYDTKQITYAEYLNLKNNIEILRAQYARDNDNQLDQTYYQTHY